MRLIIDIPEESYNILKNGYFICPGVRSGKTILQQFCRAIYNGTPLPKGYGRLGDLDALETEMVNGIRAGNYEEGYETFAHINNMDDCVECVKYADTIIEADKAESEGCE